MRYLVGFLILCAVGLAVLSLGCGQDCTLAGCSDALGVLLVPEIEVTYDVELVLDGDAEAFTCVRYNDDPREGWAPQPPPLGETSCNGKAFTRWFLGSGCTMPESVEITVSAEDESWNGSLTASPTYEVRYPNGPDCPGVCCVAQLTVTNDVDAFEVQP